MRNYKIYIAITVVYGILYLLFSYTAIGLISKKSTLLLLENEINSGKRRSEEISLISTKALESNIAKENLVKGIQESIEDVTTENIFMSVVDWSGKIICYPDITKVGTTSNQENIMDVKVKNNILARDLYQLLDQRNSDKSSLQNSEIIGLHPIASSDLIVATHINLENIGTQLDSFKNSFVFIFLILGLSILILLLAITRYLSTHYYQAIEQRSLRLEDGMLNLSKLNTSLENYQKNITAVREQKTEKESDTLEKQEITAGKDFTKKRLLTYIRNELMPVAIEDISYIYVENTITFVVRKDNKRFTTNDSLDQIYVSLDDKLFFRANRQIIVSIYAIDKIIKYSNNSLKIETKPASEIDIIIGKNKASSFKQWLDI